VRLLLLCAMATSTLGCTAQSVTGEINGEPVCVDFAVGKGGAMMKGSLQYPVQVGIIEDDEPRWQRVLLGQRSKDNDKSKFVIPDSNETYTVRFAQCSNAFAPRPVDDDTRSTDVRGTYHCGEAKVYKEVSLEIREEDASSRVINWETPPEPACWTTKTPGVQ